MSQPFAKQDRADDLIDTIVQPDIVVICDPGKLDEAGCRGAPDWIVEVLSPRGRGIAPRQCGRLREPTAATSTPA